MGELKLQFNNGAISEQNWEDLKKYIKENDVKKVLEIGCGYSTLLLSGVCDYVESLDTKESWIELVKVEVPDNVKIFKYTYPDFPPTSGEDFDMVFVDGPAGDSNGRMESMKYAASIANTVFIHDAGRPAEKKAIAEVFDKEYWDYKYITKGLGVACRLQ